MRISDWSSDVCSSDLRNPVPHADFVAAVQGPGASGPAAAGAPVPRQCLGLHTVRGSIGLVGGHGGHSGLDHRADRKSVVEGKSESVRVDLGGRRIINKKKTNTRSA